MFDEERAAVDLGPQNARDQDKSPRARDNTPSIGGHLELYV